MPRINLLPWREQQRTERKKAFAVGMFVLGEAATPLRLTGAAMIIGGLVLLKVATPE